MFQNIQLLRAVAAFMVFCFHAAPQYHAMGGRWISFERVASLGFAGVDVFFVISGFVAALTTLGKPRTAANASEFLKRRVLRIYLGYWPFFAIALAVFAVTPGQNVQQMNLLGSFFLTTVEMPRLLLYVSWSLTYELLFYIIVSATFCLPARAVVWIAHFALVGLVSVMALKWHDPLSPLFIFLAFFLEFLAGSLLFVYRQVLLTRWLIFPCAILAGIGYGLGGSIMATDGAPRIFTFGMGAVFLVMLAVVLEQSRTWQAGRFIVSLGDASYTLYLIHLILLVVFASTVRGTLAEQPLVWRELGFFLFLACGVWLSRVLYSHMELPLYRWGLNFLHISQAALKERRFR